jgi:hypothetical protein
MGEVALALEVPVEASFDRRKAFQMCVDIEDYFVELDTLLKVFEAINDYPPWVHVMRFHYDRCFERQQSLSVYLSGVR